MDESIKLMMSQSLDDNLNIKANAAMAGLCSSGTTAYNTTQAFNSGTLTTTSYPTCWHWWMDKYYPEVIRESYPVYIREQAVDKGKQAYEIIKALKDKRFMKLETVSDFIDAMDVLIKIL